MFKPKRCLLFMRRSYKIRMPWHPKRASNILSQTYNATTIYLLCNTNKLYFHWIRLPCGWHIQQHLVVTFCIMRLEKLIIFHDPKGRLTSRISQESHATKITALANLIRAQWSIHWKPNCTLLNHRRLLNSIYMVDCITFHWKAKTCHNRDALCLAQYKIPK